MKQIITILAAMTLSIGAFALPYRTAREQALFLTDKMAYELDLTDDQYNAAYEINLDYYLDVSYHGDIFGTYWNRRNTEMQYVLSPLQYRVYMQTEYFIRPINWLNNGFHFPIYDRYARNRFFRPAPRVYSTYRGGNSSRYEHSPYHGRSYGNSPDRPANGNPKAHQPSMSRRESIKEGNKTKHPGTPDNHRRH
ncbi:MAG: hypothetical protein K5910_05195 [Bacteroidales bacterium]|nr:hypothetical protein [Bacteroidales bacterium]